MASPYPIYGTAAIATMITVQGFLSILNPAAGIKVFGLPVSPSKKEALNIVTVLGARNAMVGTTMLLVCRFAPRQLLGYAVSAWFLMGLVDIVTLGRFGMKGKVGGHIGGVGMLGVCAWLLL